MGTGRRTVALAAAVALTATACDWAQFRSDAAHTGNVYETSVGVDNVAELEPLWTVDAGDGRPDGPLTVSGAVVVTSGSDVKAYEATSGALRFDVPLPQPPIEGLFRTFGSPSAHDGTIYVGFMDPLTSGGAGGGFVQVEAATGAVSEAGGGAAALSTATFAGDDLWYRFGQVAPLAQGTFVGIEGRLADGRTFRSIEPPLGGQGPISGSPPAAAGGVVYASRTTGGFLDAFDAAAIENCSDIGSFRGCTPLWSAPVEGRPSPAVSGSRVYISTTTGVAAYATGVRGPDQQPVWTADVAGPSLLALDPAGDATRVFVGSEDGSLHVFDAAGCGSAAPCPPIWRGTTGGAVTSPAVANGVVYVGSDDGYLHAFDAAGCGAATCDPLWSAATPGAPGSPIVANGRVIVTTDTGEVAAFGLPQGP